MSRAILGALAALVALPGIAAARLTAVGLDKNNYTSDFMIGHVVVSVVFVESNGGNDAQTENWSDARKAQALSEVMNGLDFWTRQNPKSPVSFTVVTETGHTGYEPITRPYWDEAQWIPQVMSGLGHTGTRFSATKSYVNALRTAHDADWGFVVYIVDSLKDADGKFADGLFAYAYLGGPYLVLTYDNNGYGISNMDCVFAHETGHIFHALDQYAGASSPGEYSYGYFRTINGNHAYASTANAPDSIMRGGIRWGLDAWSRKMLGWLDADGNGRDDIVDRSPSVTYASVASAGPPAFTGRAAVSVFPRQGNAQGQGLTVDVVAKVEYRLRNGEWASAEAVDGRFDSGGEDFRFNFGAGDLSIQTIAAQDVDVRVTTLYTANAGGDATFASASVSNAHPFPNPFRPNSNPSHTKVTFTGMSAGAKIQVFTTAGEPVFEKQLDGATSAFDWGAVNDQGQSLATGVYLYLITGADGESKDGKIAVIR